MEKKIKEWLLKKQPFVIYRKPNETTRFGWFQYNDYLNTVSVLNSSCFVFAPFSGDDKVVFLRENCEVIQDKTVVSVELSSESPVLNNPLNNKAFHLQLVQSGINAIKKGCMQKVVLSRKEQVTLVSNDYLLYFNRFLQQYSTAFVYWFFHPKVGMWMGATPEQLIKIETDVVKTVALAATQTYNQQNLNTVVWGKKEQKEQQIVTNFILNSIKPYTSELHYTKPYTYKAGSLLHIKTDIEAKLIYANDAYKIVEALHPTPALCGYPKSTAQKFILEKEGYNREFYGGYLGEWLFDNLDYSKNCDLFVNLRCMKIEENKAYLFLGGGVNAESDPESEYYETVNKSKTVKSIL